MSSVACQSLRAVNQNLRARLARLRGGHHHSAVIVPGEFTDLLAELRCAADFMRSWPAPASDAEIAAEISGYRSHLQQLEKILPSLQSRLLIEKTRLETARAHLAKAAAWAQGSKKTL
ncbi:MAG: hypothetical protein WAL32_05140 [Terriglobales bacterium]